MKTINTLRLAPLFILTLTLGACNDYLDPVNDGTLSEEEIFANAKYFCGPLMEAYNAIPTPYDFNMDMMTDNAVDNDFTGAYYLGGTGSLRPDNNPLDVWDESYKHIRQLNIFLSKMVYNDGEAYPLPLRFFSINSPADLQANIETFWRLKGEAYFLRAWYMASLLRNFGGQTGDGRVLGVPIVGGRILNSDSKLDLPRATYDECVEAILYDLKDAYDLLPLQYDANADDRVVGAKLNGRASGIAALALKARVLLYAASPAFNKPYDAQKWVDAANAAGEAIAAVGGISPALSTPAEFYFTKLNNGIYENRDIFFRSNIQGANRATEIANYPRGMYGSAALGVTQNFVDAFPDSKGYPITEEASDYDPDSPYQNRDPRLPLYVALNGSSMGPGNYYTIESYVGGKDAYDPLKQTSRTSYYLRKLMRTASVNLVPNNEASTSRANIHLGMPELYLNFAEAANEAWGPSVDGGFGFTAADVVRSIHRRYASGTALDDMNTYLNTEAAADKDKFRTLIHTERRLELSFEGHYFYDLRRWIGNDDAAKLNAVIYGMEITRSAGVYTYRPVAIEERRFVSVYQPIPYKETLNAGLPQNKGWF